MTSFLLSLGCALIAFSPALSLLILFTYSKAQLIIIVTISAFTHLLSSLVSALLYLPFSFINMGNYNAFVLIPTSILSQAFLKCGFVHLYHKVESVIESSIQRHEQEERERMEDNHGECNDDDAAAAAEVSETALLRLELNDASCGIAAGVGFGGMHTVMLYGTLLASEGGRMGTLYQPSCAVMPSLVNSAIMAFFFGILDIVWMLMIFYGMRRWKQPNQQVSESGPGAGNPSIHDWSFVKGAVGGKAAIATMIISHFVASFVTTANMGFPVNGCVIALPLLAFVTIATVSLFVIYFKDNYLPSSQKRMIRQSNHFD
mmetsp:Transcript_6305/g.7992  ORF Transcript_6305/g.7992 Transcript_6305/m.7992 type:complete len:317 (+) Transcript_6305:176-1126(+)